MKFLDSLFSISFYLTPLLYYIVSTTSNKKKEMNSKMYSYSTTYYCFLEHSTFLNTFAMFRKFPFFESCFPHVEEKSASWIFVSKTWSVTNRLVWGSNTKISKLRKEFLYRIHCVGKGWCERCLTMIALSRSWQRINSDIKF